MFPSTKTREKAKNKVKSFATRPSPAIFTANPVASKFLDAAKQLPEISTFELKYLID